ncbi:MAG: AbrB/MazE/SpoVT family DNA-binding domain-containing protein [Terracidiphilus sp.]
MIFASADSKGRITIPVEVRKKLGLNAGTRVWFIENENGEYVMKVKTGSIMNLRGIFKWTGKPVSIEEMNETIAQVGAGLLTYED